MQRKKHANKSYFCDRTLTEPLLDLCQYLRLLLCVFAIVLTQFLTFNCGIQTPWDMCWQF